MAKKIVELSTKRKVELREMSIDDIDTCTDIATYHESKDGSYVSGLARSRTAWLRRGIKGGDFKGFKKDNNGYPADSVLKQLNETEKNELVNLIQGYQNMGE
tara:strand:- start:12543 stop:12848 length:306 start_codon:yes stop_codon:yes gene_type:complete